MQAAGRQLRTHAEGLLQTQETVEETRGGVPHLTHLNAPRSIDRSDAATT